MTNVEKKNEKATGKFFRWLHKCPIDNCPEILKDEKGRMVKDKEGKVTIKCYVPELKLTVEEMLKEQESQFRDDFYIKDLDRGMKIFFTAAIVVIGSFVIAMLCAVYK